MNTLKKLPEQGERFIVGRKTSRRVGILGDSVATINGRTVPTPGITIAFKPADHLLWDSSKGEDASGRVLTADEIELVRQWAVANVPKFPDMFFVPVDEADVVKAALAEETAAEKEQRYTSGTRTSESQNPKRKK